MCPLHGHFDMESVPDPLAVKWLSRRLVSTWVLSGDPHDCLTSEQDVILVGHSPSFPWFDGNKIRHI